MKSTSHEALQYAGCVHNRATRKETVTSELDWNASQWTLSFTHTRYEFAVSLTEGLSLVCVPECNGTPKLFNRFHITWHKTQIVDFSSQYTHCQDTEPTVAMILKFNSVILTAKVTQSRVRCETSLTRMGNYLEASGRILLEGTSYVITGPRIRPLLPRAQNGALPTA
jgi:hypothetical protein